METLPKIADAIRKMVQGGVSVSDSKLSNEHIYQLIHEAREVALKAIFSKERRIQSVWTQQYFPDFQQELQDEDCCIKFSIPSTISLDNKTDGLMYAGHIKGNCAYRKAASRAELSNRNKHRISKQKDVSTGGVVRCLYSDGLLELYGDKNIKSMRVDAIFSKPSLLPTYNIDVDIYPIDGNSLALVKQQVSGILMNEVARPADKKQDNKDNEIYAQ